MAHTGLPVLADATPGFGDFLQTTGWWLVLLLLLGFVALAIGSARRKARQRRVAAELAGRRLLAESMRELGDRTGPPDASATSEE